jgi:hypothetical protein
MCIIGTGIECSRSPMSVIGNRLHSMPVSNVNLESKKKEFTNGIFLYFTYIGV